MSHDIKLSPGDVGAGGGVVPGCGRGRETVPGVVTRLLPHRAHQLGLGLHEPGHEGVGADLHVHDLVGLGAHGLGDVVALVVVLDHLAPGHALLVAVGLEAGDADLLGLLDIVQVAVVLILVDPDHPWAVDLVDRGSWGAIAGGSSGGMTIASSWGGGRMSVASSWSWLSISWGGGAMAELMVDKGLDLGLVLGHGHQGQAGADYENLKISK